MIRLLLMMKGQVRCRANLTVKFKAVMIGANGSDPFGADVMGQEDLDVSDYIQFGTTLATLSKLVVTED